MIASGTAVRTSTNPACRAASLTGGTEGSAPAVAQLAANPTTISNGVIPRTRRMRLIVPVDAATRAIDARVSGHGDSPDPGQRRCARRFGADCSHGRRSRLATVPMVPPRSWTGVPLSHRSEHDRVSLVPVTVYRTAY